MCVCVCVCVCVYIYELNPVPFLIFYTYFKSSPPFFPENIEPSLVYSFVSPSVHVRISLYLHPFFSEVVSLLPSTVTCVCVSCSVVSDSL